MACEYECLPSPKLCNFFIRSDIHTRCMQAIFPDKIVFKLAGRYVLVRAAAIDHLLSVYNLHLPLGALDPSKQLLKIVLLEFLWRPRIVCWNFQMPEGKKVG